jgi:hypothetical protein
MSAMTTKAFRKEITTVTDDTRASGVDPVLSCRSITASSNGWRAHFSAVGRLRKSSPWRPGPMPPLVVSTGETRSQK